MNKHILLFLILGVTAGSVQAAGPKASYQTPASKEESTGFFSGVVLGALTGGPPGAIVGGALGAMIGDGWHAKQEVGDLQANLYTLQLQIAQHREHSARLRLEYEQVIEQLDTLNSNRAQVQRARFGMQAVTACCDNTSLSLHFRSGSSVIEPQFEEQLTALVRLAQQMPASRVEITGYADRTGDAEHNLALSRARTEAVRAFLQQQGAPDSTITTVAYGEAKPLHAEQTLETDFFDRRVTVRLRDSSNGMLTQNPDAR